ncbi:RxLR effector protein [Phytophthora megakarya]|uniref:RxLR effector protein n=1 Tax=Phytophthora megakarya TaxID=4795 RepID=A0A225WN13_9STRA|nr:RxLR effector protein [Phytophthora megakarya]
MRFNVFIALLVTTFIICNPTFGTAEMVANVAEVRRLRAEGSPKTHKPQIKFVSEAMVQGAVKNPKSWPRLKKFAKITLGATVGALAIYGAYKLMTKETAAAVDATTTTGSA